MSAEVGLRLLLKGQREMSAGLSDITKQTGDLGKVADKTATAAKQLSGGLDSIQKSGVGATASTKAQIVWTQKLADAQQGAAAASKAAADARLKAAAALTDATEKQAAGDIEGAKAARDHAAALQSQAMAANRSAIAMRASAGAVREQIGAIKASEAAMRSRGATGGGSALFGGLSKAGGVLAKTGAAVGGYMGYEGVKRVGSLEGAITQLGTLANVPKGQLSSLQSFAINASPGLREDPNTIVSQMYRIASASPGKPYTLAQLESLERGAAGLSDLLGPTADPALVARVFGIVRANGGLGTTSPQQIAAIAAATIGQGDMLPGDYISALGSGGLAVNAARHKITLTQLGGILAQEGDLGVTGSRAGTALTHAISLLASPSTTAAGIYGSIGLKQTAVDQVIRSKGLTAGIALLRQQLMATLPASMRGQTATVGQFRGLGYSSKQAHAMASQGPQSMIDLELTRMFGGARQSIPIISLFQGLDRTNSKTAAVNAAANPAAYQAHLNAALATPGMQWKNFDLGVQKLENDLGLKLIPKLESAANWVEKNKSDLEDLAKVLGVLAIPAIAAYSANLAMKGVTSMTNFSNALRGVQNETPGTVGGINKIGVAVGGVTAAIGVWELGRATASHGAGGALTAGLGGAVTGMMLGFAVGGPFGAAVGAAGGALVGLAGHFWGVSHQASAAQTAIDNFNTSLKNSYAADKYKLGASSNQSILSFINGFPLGTQQIFKAGGVNINNIDRFLKTGSYATGAGAQIQAAAAAGRITQAQETIGLTALGSIATQFQDIVTSTSAMAEISGDVSANAKGEVAKLGDLLNGLGNKPISGTSGGLGGLLNGGGGHGSIARLLGGIAGVSGPNETHIHVNLDGREVAHVVHNHDRRTLARR